MTLSQRAVEAALEAYVQHPIKAKGDAMGAMKAALTAALAVDGLCLVEKTALQRVVDIAARNESAPEIVKVIGMLAASTVDSPRQTEG